MKLRSIISALLVICFLVGIGLVISGRMGTGSGLADVVSGLVAMSVFLLVIAVAIKRMVPLSRGKAHDRCRMAAPPRVVKKRLD